jgi:hypothetical protein
MGFLLYTKRIALNLLIFCSFFILLFAVVFLTNINSTNAQIPIGIDEQISFVTYPENPEPNELVTIRINSYFTDLDKDTISWYVDGSFYDSGIGLREIELNAGDIGSTKTFFVEIIKQDGGILKENYSITPVDVDVVRESLTYTHPFYKGKSLSSNESDSLFIAIPNFFDASGNKIDDEEIVFTWKIDGTIDGRESGIGKNTYYYEEDVISRPVEVIVEVSPVSSNLSAVEVKTFNYQEPEVLFYESNPVLGTLYNNALGEDMELPSREIEITSIPYFFNVLDLGALSFDWTVNNQRINSTELDHINKITLRRIKDSSFNSLVKLNVTNENTLLQTASKSFNIYYDE